ncbi:BRO-N domain-containing protein, partial [Brevibacillus borstelensis]
MQALQNVFSFQEKQVRVVVKDGEPWFVARDVCAILEIGNTSQALVRLDDDEKGVISTDTPGGVQEMAAVNESGLYELVLGSKKQEAKEFKRWIKREVLPSIRKTGAYAVSENKIVPLSERQALIQSLK